MIDKDTSLLTVGLIGGDEFRHQATAVDRRLLQLARKSPPSVAILPTAAVPENAPLAAANGVTHFQRLGVTAYEVMIVDKATASDQALIDNLQRADIVYLTGGNPAYLLQCLHGSQAWSYLVEASRKGVVIAGSSAGAMVLATRLRYRGEVLDSLGLVPNVTVIPHFEKWSPESIQELQTSVEGGHTLLGIDGATGCILTRGKWEVVGPGRVTIITAERVQSLSERATFELH